MEPTDDRPNLDGVEFKSISQQDNSHLVAPFEEGEVKAAVWECGSMKSSGPDGLNFKFIKEFWNVMKMNVMHFLGEFYANEIFPRGSNALFIALIPKVHDPQGLNEYISISLIGCIYKIVDKILSSGLKKVLPGIIDE